MTHPSIQAVIDRAASDPDFVQRLAADPSGTAAAEGIEVDAEHLKTFLGLENATEGQMAEALQARLSHSAPTPGYNGV